MNRRYEPDSEENQLEILSPSGSSQVRLQKGLFQAVADLPLETVLCTPYDPCLPFGHPIALMLVRLGPCLPAAALTGQDSHLQVLLSQFDQRSCHLQLQAPRPPLRTASL